MATNYNIYLINNMTSSQTFWCFLSAPSANNTGTVYANSSAYLTLKPGSTNANSFTVPVQYSLQASASNNAVGLNVQINSTASQNVNLGDKWEADFFKPTLHQGPDLLNKGTGSSTSLQYVTSSYDQSLEGPSNWYGCETFGIQTAQGFIGVSWSPVANSTATITPILQFYIATGTYTANSLADMTTVSTQSQTVALSDFDQALNCTVTIDSSGNWHIKPGKPQTSSAEVASILESHLNLTRAHCELVSFVTSSANLLNKSETNEVLLLSSSIEPDQEDTVKEVTWDKSTEITHAGQTGTTATGVVVVTTAAAFAFTTFICSGINFTANGVTQGGTRWTFKYDGNSTLAALQDALKAGAKIVLKR